MSHHNTSAGCEHRLGNRIRRKYQLGPALTPERLQRLGKLGDRRARALARRVVEDDATGERRGKLLQEKENYRVYELQEDTEAAPQVPVTAETCTLKGVLLLHNSSCEEVLRLLSPTKPANVAALFGDLFGALYVDSTALDGAAPSSSSSSSSSASTSSMAFDWLLLRDVSAQLPQRDVVFMRYSHQTVDPDDPRRVTWGASVWEPLDDQEAFPMCRPLGPTTEIRRERPRTCGFVVEASEHSDTTRVTLFWSGASVADRPWLLKVTSSVVRFIPSALVNYRIRHHDFVDKRQWRSTEACGLCTQTFGLFRRQHHCRLCGGAVCSKCASVRDQNVRVCLSCIQGEDMSALWGNLTMARKQSISTLSSSSMSLSTAKSASGCTPGGGFQDSWSSSTASSMDGHPVLPVGRGASLHELSRVSAGESFSSAARVSSVDEEFVDGFAARLKMSTSTASFCSSTSTTSRDDDEDDVLDNTVFTYPLTYAKGNPWPDAPRPMTETARLARIQTLNLSQQYARDHLHELLELARTSVACPVASVAVVAVSSALLVTAVGLIAGEQQLPRDVALEAHVLMAKDPVIVLDTQKDERFAMNPLVSSLNIRFFCGIPLVTKEGIVIGSLSLGDTSPRERVAGADVRALQRLAQRIVAKMDANNIESTKEVEGVMLF